MTSGARPPTICPKSTHWGGQRRWWWIKKGGCCWTMGLADCLSSSKCLWIDLLLPPHPSHKYAPTTPSVPLPLWGVRMTRMWSWTGLCAFSTEPPVQWQLVPVTAGEKTNHTRILEGNLLVHSHLLLHQPCTRLNICFRRSWSSAKRLSQKEEHKPRHRLNLRQRTCYSHRYCSLQLFALFPTAMGVGSWGNLTCTY